jgi:hypothetical protein
MFKKSRQQRSLGGRKAMASDVDRIFSKWFGNLDTVELFPETFGR